MASITPDPKKRGYLLPPGCKDLVDVLRRRDRRQIKAGVDVIRRRVTTHAETVTGPLSEVERHVTVAWESGAMVCSLRLDSLEEEFTVHLHRGKGVAASASLHVQTGTDREKAVREFVGRHGFPLPVDTGMPRLFRPALPVYQIFHLAPLSSEAPLVARLLKALFHEVAGLNDDSVLRFRYDATTMAA